MHCTDRFAPPPPPSSFCIAYNYVSWYQWLAGPAILPLFSILQHFTVTEHAIQWERLERVVFLYRPSSLNTGGYMHGRSSLFLAVTLIHQIVAFTPIHLKSVKNTHPHCRAVCHLK